MIVGRGLAVAGGLLILLGALLGLIGASYADKGAVLSHEVSCGAPWFPSFDSSGDAAVCHAVTEPRAELATGLVILGGIALIASATPRRTVAA